MDLSLARYLALVPLAWLSLGACSGRDGSSAGPEALAPHPPSPVLSPWPAPSVPASAAPTPTSPAFDVQILDPAFRAEGVAVFDVDHDGHLDLVTDQYWYAGPTFTPHEIRTPQTFDGADGYSVCQAVFGVDVDGDGWTDAVVSPFMWDPAAPPPEPMLWYRNPGGAGGTGDAGDAGDAGGADGHWTSYVLAPSTAVETTITADLFGDGRTEVIMGQEPPEVLQWFVPGADPTQPWTAHSISADDFAGAWHFAHGLGTGDVDGDGKLDVLTGYGWFQQTADPDTWTWHAFSFGANPDACSDMYAYDVDADGLADVLCSAPHDYGIHWWQQQRPDGGGDPTFVDHLIDDTLSQMHALDLVDLDGDGTPELVSGKRWWAHGPTGDPGATDPAILTYYALTRGPAGVTFARHDVDSASGIGTQFPVTDVDGDGKPDIVVSNKKGLFFFRRR